MDWNGCHIDLIEQNRDKPGSPWAELARMSGVQVAWMLVNGQFEAVLVAGNGFPLRVALDKTSKSEILVEYNLHRA
jgi:hypothetical protein